MAFDGVGARHLGGDVPARQHRMIVATRISRTARRSERAGEERLEILREQQQRLHLLHEERSALLDTLELLRRQMDETERRLELPPAPPEAASQWAAGEPEGPDGTDPRSGTGGAQEGSEPRSSRWRKLLGG